MWVLSGSATQQGHASDRALPRIIAPLIAGLYRPLQGDGAIE